MKRVIENASVIAILCVISGLAFLGGIAVGQSAAPPPLTLEQHNELFTNMNTDKNLYIQQEAVQKKYSDTCNAAMNNDPAYKDLVQKKQDVDIKINDQVSSLTHGVDPKQWVLNLDTGTWEKPQAEKK